MNNLGEKIAAGEWLAKFHLQMVREPVKETPLRAELFGIEQLSRHAKAIAEQHKVGVRKAKNRLLARLNENEKILQGFNRSTLTVDQTRRVTPAAEWLLDNFFLIEEQVQMARRHLPRHYSRELPQLVQGPAAKLPRVYDLILELISHVDAQIDLEHLSAFVAAYQTVTPLNLGELWAVPIMLRLGLIENLRRIATRLSADRLSRNEADLWADRMRSVAETDPANLIVVVAELAKAKVELCSAFVTEFCQRVSRMDSSIHFAREWIEQRVMEQGHSIEELTRAESQNQAADQVSISHTITSLRFLSATDWREFVESMSVVERTLRNDPANVYHLMDFATRDRYRHSIERMARHGKLSENEVAWKAIELSEESARKKDPKCRSAHVGFFLIGEGQPTLERTSQIRWPARVLFERLIRRFPLALYAGAIALVAMPSTLLLAWYVHERGAEGWRLGFAALLLLICLSQLAVSLTNWFFMLFVKPRLLPRMDFSATIAPDCATMVVVPTMLASFEGIERLLESLEIHYLANRDPNLRFALLTDFRDADQETMPEDEGLLQRVSEGIKDLNLKYAAEDPDSFFLFHRPRRWNETEGSWMGYERKRGKLSEFNALLRGRGQERFSCIVGDLSRLPAIRFVITLDTDTQLPRDAGRRLIGTIAHPLNQPRLDPETGIVCEGYGILQPRVGVSLPSAGRSWFVRIFAGDAGVDPYTRTVSDVYQDVFDQGSFIGKGIYDVDAFEHALQGRFPDNTILSHDLIESAHARSGLVSDVELYEEHPSRYNADISRRHRWIRGDWQIALWLLPRVPGPDARRIANPLSGLSQWKILDNLRRSLVPAAFLLLLLGSWMALPELYHIGTMTILAIMVIPGLIAAASEAVNKPDEWPFLMHLQLLARNCARQFGQIALTLVFLPYDAYISLDAIARTWARMMFTRKRLLEWQTSSEAERMACTNLGGFYTSMWVAPALAVTTLSYLILKVPEHLPLALPFIVIWVFAPLVAWWISRPIIAKVPELSQKQFAFLHRTARKTWRFFENFVIARENWLPPDNYQEHPDPTIASRTSPTNMGLALLANLAAYDFGYLTADGLLQRTRNTLGTMAKLERHRGHFYNWYDTRSLRALPPLYLSTVDSGNLAGHLLTLSTGLKECADQKILSARAFQGLRDTLGVLGEQTGRNSMLDRADALLADAPSTLPEAHELLKQLVTEASAITEAFARHPGNVQWWSSAFEKSCREYLAELDLLAPWLPLLLEWELDKPTVVAKHSSDTGNGSPSISRNGNGAETKDALAELRQNLTLREVAKLNQSLGLQIESMPDHWSRPWSDKLRNALREGSQRAGERLIALESLAREAQELAQMDFNFLFDPVRELFSIGYNISEHRRDQGFYDLLASEARLGSYVAIAQGDVPQKHWFSLGRTLIAARGSPVLVSWSGSMFEYLMPLLVMPTYENTLIDQTYKSAVNAQIDYGRMRGVPWGISESGYNLTDAQLNYQYRAFGVPGLGFKRGLADDLVVAPYASVMALMVAPREACQNLQLLADESRMGEFGFYEAVDYTASRLPPNETSVTIRSFMAHHQGMSLLSLAYLLLDRPMQRRFLAYAPFKSEELLLQERIPKAITTLAAEHFDLNETRLEPPDNEGAMRVLVDPNISSPQVHLLSNGRYHVMITNAGGGYSRWNDLALTRWREDPTRDSWGSFCYLRDVETGEFWSAAYQPTLHAGKNHETIFTQARAEFRKTLGSLEIHAEVSVSPEDDVEMRRIKLSNHGPEARTIELTTYAEVVLTTPAADASHPAFGNLFVQTEFVKEHPALLCTRRARAEEERPPWLLHLMAIQGAELGELSYETDRSKFLGRGKTVAAPAAMQSFSPLSNSVGPVLDPIVSLRRTLSIAPESTVQIELVMGVATNRETAISLVEKYHDLRMGDRLFDLAWTHSQVTLRHLGATEAEAQFYGRMAGPLVYADGLRRAQASILLSNRRGQSGLWSYGISGDSPIVLVRISNSNKMELVRRLVQAHAYWRLKGLMVELVIVNEDTSIYRQSLHEQILSLIASGIEAQMLDKAGGIFVRRLEQIPSEDRILLQSIARLVLSDENGTLEEQFQRRAVKEPLIPELKPSRLPTDEFTAPLPRRELICFNGLGGFTVDGREYVITMHPERPLQTQKKNAPLLNIVPWRVEWPKLLQRRSESESTTTNRLAPSESASAATENPDALSNHITPAPWVNVIANPRFGTVISESGGAYTWMENSHEFRLTPWNNDPVGDLSGEAFYLRDEETGEFWSPMPLPARGVTPYVTRHGFGYSVFEHIENGIASEVWVYVAMDAPVKFNVVKLRNLSGRPRRLSVTGYWQWVLGEGRGGSSLHVHTETDPQSGAFLARNYYNSEFMERVAFVDVNDSARSVTGDRKEFVGRNRTMANPLAMKKTRLSGKTGPGLDPCAGMQVMIDLPGRNEKEIVFRLGAADNIQEAQDLIGRFRQPGAAHKALEGVWDYWNRTLGAVNIETPDPATNVMVNGWLLYQTLSCRYWGRTGFYQSGGAYGFRDQLQDVMAFVHTEPALLREHLLRAAAHQFPMGDVQHWWHPPMNRGVRTHFSDDYLWLPYATCRYVKCLGDTGVLDEKISFIEGRTLKPEEESNYDLPTRSDQSATLYEHCVRAIEYGLKFGEHGLPLIGCGDWNDGMNLVGQHGNGESVWLAFFLFDVLTQFADLARQHNDMAFATRCLAQAAMLRQNIEQHAWDGQWYRRAYFDNGDPLGSAQNPECQIDSLPQSWAVMTGAGDPERSRQAMQAVEDRLVRREAGLIQLFDPPFDKSSLNPGYIKGYLPGVRENGGQYTHGAIWTVMAFAQLGRNQLAWDLFSLLNPVNHARTPAQTFVYKVEPYVVAADVYAVSPHVGRGGWTWYTGSAGWMYRLVTETLLGLTLESEKLRIQPRMPRAWGSFKIHYRHNKTFYHLTFTRSAAVLPDHIEITLDGQALSENFIPLINDEQQHQVIIQVGQEFADETHSSAKPTENRPSQVGTRLNPKNRSF